MREFFPQVFWMHSMNRKFDPFSLYIEFQPERATSRRTWQGSIKEITGAIRITCCALTLSAQKSTCWAGFHGS
jgi:hypothetical protein